MSEATSVSSTIANRTGQPPSQGMFQADGFFSPVTLGQPNNPSGAGPSIGPPRFPGGPATIPPTFVAAAGATQGNATALAGPGMYIASATASTEGLRLPAAATGLGLWIWPTAAHGLKVYPALHQFIDAGASNVSESQAAGKGVMYYAKDAAHWVTFKST